MNSKNNNVRMKLQTLQVIKIFIECKNIVGGASVHTSKHSLFRLKIMVGCRFCTCPSIRVCGGGVCVCMCRRVLCVCVETVLRVCCVLWCIVVCVCRYVLCWCWCWCAMCGALCAWCVSSGPRCSASRPVWTRRNITCCCAENCGLPQSQFLVGRRFPVAVQRLISMVLLFSRP